MYRRVRFSEREDCVRFRVSYGPRGNTPEIILLVTPPPPHLAPSGTTAPYAMGHQHKTISRFWVVMGWESHPMG